MTMSVSNILTQTSDAKVAHQRWVKRAEHLISGLPVKKEFIPLEPTSCVFGKWFYAQGKQLGTLESIKEIFKKIEINHNELHDTYRKIYDIYFVTPQNRSFLHKVMTLNSKHISKSEQEEAKKYYAVLEKSSETLMGYVEQFESKVKILTYSDLTFD